MLFGVLGATRRAAYVREHSDCDQAHAASTTIVLYAESTAGNLSLC